MKKRSLPLWKKSATTPRKWRKTKENGATQTDCTVSYIGLSFRAPLKMQSASFKIGQLLDRFVHYKLALHVFAVASYMEVMLSKNFSADYLDKVSEDLRQCAYQYRELYTRTFGKIEVLKQEAITSQTVKKTAKLTKSVGEFIGSIPLIKEGPVDEFLIGVGESMNEAEKKKLQETLSFFARHKDSGIVPIVEYIDSINRISNRPTIMLFDRNVISFSEIQAAS